MARFYKVRFLSRWVGSALIFGAGAAVIAPGVGTLIMMLACLVLLNLIIEMMIYIFDTLVKMACRKTKRRA